MQELIQDTIHDHFATNSRGFDHYLDELTEMVMQQQAIQFDTLKEARRHRAALRDRLEKILMQTNAMFVEGLRLLMKTDHRIVVQIVKKIHDHLQEPDQIAAIIDAEIIQRPDALELFSIAVNSFYGCGDFHVEECVLSVLLTLFPMEPQPFACYGTLIWRKNGIADAVAYYKKIIDMFESPVLDYFAADCFIKSDNQVAAKAVLERAMRKIQESPECYDEIDNLIRNLLQQI